AADFVITGWGTGVGAMLAANIFPGVVCGFAGDPTDAYLFSQIHGGNALSLPFAKGFGWGAELNLKLLFERLFAEERG
ncbi:RpiB/LacA/LacB family sugar-phosphate isomerase, partial [Streptococcus suis]